MVSLEEISELVQKGKAKNVKVLIQEALNEGMDSKTLLNEGLLSGMLTLGEKFRNNEVFVPEVLIASRAMSTGIDLLRPELTKNGNHVIGKVVIGTVEGDLHDIGKKLVSMMLKGAGFEIYDVGVDVSVDEFINKAEEVEADIICLSALLTTTMYKMKDVVEELSNRRIREKYIVMIGGAPVCQSFANNIGADYYTRDAVTAAQTAKEAILSRQVLLA